jgi:hypothetical protein
MFFRYQDSTGQKYVPLKVPPKSAPYATRHNLIRNGNQALLGQDPFDVDNAGGPYYLSPSGWAQPFRVPRVPRSLVLLGSVLVTNTDFQTQLATILGPLQDMNVDVYTIQGFVRFSSAVPMTDVNYDDVLLTTSAGGISPKFGSMVPVSPSDLTGGDVMYAAVGSDLSGYLNGELDGNIDSNPASPTFGQVLWSSQSGDDPGYLFILKNITSPNFSETITILGTAPFGVNYCQNSPQALDEANALIAVSARCRKFAFDVYGNTDDPGVASGIPKLTVAEADLAFRNGVPGTFYTYALSDSISLANAIVANALAFFS